MLRITLALSVSLCNPYMTLSNLLKLGMPKWIAFSLTLVFLDAHLIILVLYVDDLILIGNDPKLITHVIKRNFEMSDLGHLHYFLSLRVLQTK